MSEIAELAREVRRLLDEVRLLRSGLSDLDEELRRYRIKKVSRGPKQVLEPRGEDIILEREMWGFLMFSYLSTDNPEMGVAIDLYGDGTVELFISPKGLKIDRLAMPTPGSGFITRYDPTTSQYVAFFTPARWIPWRGFAKVKAVNPSLSRATYTFISWLLERVEPL